MRGLDEKAIQAKEKKAALGPDIDVDSFQSEPVHHDYIDDLGALSEADKKQMILAGGPSHRPGNERSGRGRIYPVPHREYT